MTTFTKRKRSIRLEPSLLSSPPEIATESPLRRAGSILRRNSRITIFILSLFISFVLLRAPSLDLETNEETRHRTLAQETTLFWRQQRGLVIFYHLPKTGGTFVRDTLIQNNIPVERVFSSKQLLGNKYGDRIQKLLTGEASELLVLELHGRFDGIPQLPIRTWRDMAHQHGVPFFAFTLLRDPVAFHDSYFYFFHRPGCEYRWCEPNIYDEMNENNLLDSLVPNKQCELLYHGQLELKWNITEDRSVSKAQCDVVEKVLSDDWNWVGTTEQISKTTMPILFRLLLNQDPPNHAAFVRHVKVVHSLRTIKAIREISWMDQHLYTSRKSRESYK